ncbi:CHASE2 domain-containing protein [Iningainema tapete]|uniref:non-specific serine/threonine protein kinase n=1 Tax=Iningainema tapete BLCC-T55 TaxID=2748662 RepID=A0A8J6XNU6_9CYAN|nr:CHASE2 domain-containing protein [Iningainema tapete]MBD2774516.1 CHASE2 domain-containing protein [Iningainema tapete BLCC-T55]
MAEKPTSTLTKKASTASHQPSSKLTKLTSTVLAWQLKQMNRLGHLLSGVSVVGATLLTTSSLNLAQFMENQAQSMFYLLRGPIAPNEDIVILAIDDQSISIPEDYYGTDSKQYAYLEPLKSFPYQRHAYAIAIEKLIASGARSVAINVLFDTPSSYGVEDDEKLRSSLQQHGTKVTLAALYENSHTYQGQTTQLKLPSQMFLTGATSVGLVNFPIEPDGKIHKLASELHKLTPEENALTPKIPTFSEAVLRSANVKYPKPKGSRIYFNGAAGTFKVIPFWYLFDPQNWDTFLQQGKVFQDKIVLIGATAKLSNDYHPVAVSDSWLYQTPMSGVEIHASAIATLMEGKTVALAIETPQGRGLFVLALVGGYAVIVARIKRGISRLVYCLGGAIAWSTTSYILFVYAQFLIPTAVPVGAITLIGLGYLGTEAFREIVRKSQLIDIFQKYASHYVVQEILSQQDDLRDLLQQRSKAVSGKILDWRYKIVKVLGSGGFSETYVAEDTKLPGNPLCVVKQLKPVNNKSEQLAVARRLFNSEAQTLQKLGTHNQIPQLLAYFEEEEEFYLVQEYIIGHALSQELPKGKRLPQTAVIEILRDLLQTLTFVHQNGVIHRDIKPSNIIRREKDQKLVLIDFGAVKEVTTQLLDHQEQTAFTIGIGTKGYAPTEQCFGRPQYSSDIYAVGMIGIKALTGMTPHEIVRDANGELKWIDKAYVSHTLANILSQMVREDFQQRYQSAPQALAALNNLINSEEGQLPTQGVSMTTVILEDDSDTPTTPWTGALDETPSISSTSILPPRNQS